MRDFQLVQLRVGAAGARIDAARRDAAQRLPRGAGDRGARRRAGSRDEAALQAQPRVCGQLCTEAVDTLHTLAGANGIYEKYPLERILRDAHALGGHIMHNFDTQATAWGYAALGGEVNNPTL